MITFNESRWCTDEEFKDSLTKHRFWELTNSSGVPLLVDGNDIYIDDKDNHTLIFGNTGSKKTRNFVIPTIYSMGMAGENLIISDPKGEVYRYTSGFLNSMDYNIKIINLRNPELGNGWNPLLLPYRLFKNGDKNRGIEMVTDFCNQLKTLVHSDKDVYWENVACDTLIGLVLLMFEFVSDEKDVCLSNVQQIKMSIKIYENDGENIFWDIYDGLQEGSIVKYKLSSVSSLRKVEKTLGSMLSVLDGMLAVFLTQENLLDMLSVDHIIYDDIDTTKTAIYIITPDEKKTYHFLVSAFTKQCYEYLIYTAHIQHSGKLPIRVNFVLDEFSNITKISDMSAMISASRSRNIRFVLIVQSKQQLLSLYDKDANVICSNCSNWIYLPCREMELLDEIEKLCGEVYIDNRGYIPLIGKSALQRLKIGMQDSQALVLRMQMYPYISWVKDFECYPQSKHNELPMESRASRSYKPISLNSIWLQYIRNRFR